MKVMRNQVLDEFGDFDDDEKWNNKVPRAQHFAEAQKLFHTTIHFHLSKEVKNVVPAHSCIMHHTTKKKLCQHKEHAIFNGLTTATNEVGEV